MKPTYDIRCWKKFPLGLSLLLAATFASAKDNWTIHEWGTFTSLQNEQGDTIGAINTDDEPVPAFVHRVANTSLQRPSEIPNSFSKGITRAMADVTMRLETPVIYFHPPKTETKIQDASVQVKFRGGWLTEFYPDADATVPERENENVFPRTASTSLGKIEWNNLKIGGNWSLTSTTDHVWTSPRAVEAASVQTAKGESEKFLFYRGVGHINAPLRISRDAITGELLFRSQLEDLPTEKSLAIHSIWLVDIKPGGKIAFRPLPPLALNANPKRILTHTPPAFASSEFSTGNLEKLKTSLQSALISEGLFADEAQALLNTWETSYFKSTGLRVFFLVPREWTDFYLPLEISQPAQISRVMVGRIELVTPEQRNILREIAQLSPAEIATQAGQFQTNFMDHASQIFPEINQLDAGKKSLSAFILIPKSYRTYLSLGRFRNALILDQAKAHSTAGLTSFISTYGLKAHNSADIPSIPTAFN